LYKPWKITEGLARIAAIAQELDRIEQELKPQLGWRWAVKPRRLSKTVMKLHATTARLYRDSRIMGAMASETAYVPSEHIKAKVIGKVFETPAVIAETSTAEALFRLDALVEEESQCDIEALIHRETKAIPVIPKPVIVTTVRRRMAYLPGVDRRRDD
jgi:hypothetical protein